jgi:23S rRNA (adenine2503-C2)-methyltransferase
MKMASKAHHPLIKYSAKDFDAQESFLYKFMVDDNRPVEVGVYIHWLGSRLVDVAIDISCMSGCTRKCIFCAAAQISGKKLTALEMYEQVDAALVQISIDKPRLIIDGTKLTFSFQGMGEPSEPAVAPEIFKCINLIKNSLASSYEVEFSISSILDSFLSLEDWASVGLKTLQISLHAPSDELRKTIIGKSTKKKISDIFAAVKRFEKSSPSTEIKINYLIIAGLNDGDEQLRDLIALMVAQPRYFLKLSYLNDTGNSLSARLNASIRCEYFLKECLLKGINAYKYGGFQNIGFSCGQLASYADLPKSHALR